MNNTVRSLRLFLWLTLLTGLIYPLVMTVLAQVTFSEKANGSFLTHKEKIVGSSLIGQKFEDPKYFWSRPSAVDYDPMASAGSNLGPTSKELQTLVRQRQEKIASAHDVKDFSLIPSELLYASASGIDPDISPDAAYFQIERVVKARATASLTADSVRKLVDHSIKRRALGFIGQPCVNVLELNIALDESK